MKQEKQHLGLSIQSLRLLAQLYVGLCVCPAHFKILKDGQTVIWKLLMRAINL